MILLLFGSGADAQDKVTRETFAYGDRQREFFLYVPDRLKADSPAPLLVALHGSGRDGASLVNPWKNLARKEGIIVVGPNSLDRAGWNLKSEGPDFFLALVQAVTAKYPVDPRRMHLFGHSAGAIQGLIMGILEAEYFAAVAVHAGSLPKETWHLIDKADRKIPMAIWVGTNDAFFPMPSVSATKTALEAKGIPVQLRPINNHDHNYYRRSDEINQEAWTFLKAVKLDNEPRFKRYETR